MKLLFVYNVDSNLTALIATTAHKLVSPSTHTCNLCKLTYPFISMKSEWKKFIDSLPYEVVSLHRDEFVKQYPDQKNVQLPAVFTEDDAGICLLISQEKINKVKNFQELIKIVEYFLPKQQDDKILYRCSECGFRYKDKEIAEKCQIWCKEHKSCNLDIIKYAEKEIEEKS